MATDARPVRPRRSPAPPAALRDEHVRAPLLAILARRFEVAVTVVNAGAGFGKTTLLAQAVRASMAAPNGIDAWVSCQPGDEDPVELASAIAGALGASPAGRAGPTDVVLRALVDRGPVDVCLILDDVHEVPDGSEAAHLLADLVRRRPPHVHLVLAGRCAPPVPLARLRAAGEVIELGEQDLAFGPDEAGALATAAGRPVGCVEGLAGWPSLVRLAVSAPGGAPGAFLWEEVLDGLADDERRALLALATLGDGDGRDVAEVAGGPVDLAAMAAGVPLVTAEGDGRWRAHQLWEHAAARSLPQEQLQRLRRRAVDVLVGRGDVVAAGWRACGWGEVELLARAARELVKGTLGALPVETAERWLADLHGAAGHPDLRLLAVAARHAQRGGGEVLDREIDAVAAQHAVEGDSDGEAVALALGVVAAHFRGDLGRVVALACRLRDLPQVDDDPVLRFLMGAIEAGTAALTGDPEGALSAIDALPSRGVDARTAELVDRLEVSMLLLLGRADDAVTVAEASLTRAPSAYVRSIPPVVRWVAGDPSAFLSCDLPAEPAPDTNARDRLYHAAYGTSVFASLGDRDALERAWPAIAARATADLDARDGAIVAGAVATRRVLEHDDAGAAAALRAHIARHPLAVPGSDLHLRRVLAVVHVLDADARAHWDARQLGPTHDRARRIARALLAARAGRVRPDPPAAPAAVLTTLPLPWTAELAARAAGAGRPWGAELASEVADWVGDGVRRELARLLDDAAGDAHEAEALTRGARSLLAELPDGDAPTVRIEVLGPARVLIGGKPVDAPNLRRGRVRTLLALLAVAGPLRRDRATELLWPDHDPADAARNLRVLLARLRTVLEPDDPSRPGARAGAALRADGEMVRLAGPPRVDVDVWELARVTDLAKRAHEAGEASEQARHLARAAELWRGEPLTDLDVVVDLGPDVEHVRMSLVDAVLKLGELRLASGRAADAVRCGEHARAAAPFDERAHRLLLAAALQRRDPATVTAVVDEVETALSEVGADPEPPTAMLLRQARQLARCRPERLGA
ncbi:MAG TPA: BTAD domain-containing putative transcriptional regulator [Acidimicrobiales bacterium]|nr:BTAD domain-containing putative transcriptional regulator [Acidimicrobiales bacterium]